MSVLVLTIIRGAGWGGGVPNSVFNKIIGAYS